VVLLGRSALESMFNMVAAVEDRQFGPQRIALEYIELARKIRSLVEKQAWPASRRPTPEECDREAERICRTYTVSVPASRKDRSLKPSGHPERRPRFPYPESHDRPVPRHILCVSGALWCFPNQSMRRRVGFARKKIEHSGG
jgi:hypothetical protein